MVLKNIAEIVGGAGGGAVGLWKLGAAGLASQARAGAVSCRDIVDAHLERIDAVNDAVGAVAVILREEAQEEASRADAVPLADRGPLHGVPFTVKGSLDCLGSATTFGVPALRRQQPYLDHPAVARLRAAGAIPVGRSNLSELGMRLCTQNPLYGSTRNPWDHRRTAGGSSGGDAAAVATGMVPFGLGSDMGGSLRVPAQCCGVASLKPSAGRVPHAASLPPEDLGLAAQLTLAVGPIARSVEDLRLVLGVIAGRDVRDPLSVDVPLRGGARPRSAALVTALPGAPLPDEAVHAIQQAGEALRARGWVVVEASPPELARAAALWETLLAAELDAMIPMSGPILSPALRAYLERLARWSRRHAISPHRLHAERMRLGRLWSRFFGRHSVVVGPCWAAPVWGLGEDLRVGVDVISEMARMITPVSVLGLPAVTVPVGVGRGGLPGSVQICADRWRSDLCLDAAACIEAAVGVVAPISPR